MNVHAPLRLWREARDYLAITLGVIIYTLGWTCFLLPYQITTGAVTGVAAIIFYASGIPIQISYFTINAVLLVVALKILGFKFCIRTIYGVLSMTFFLWFFQVVLKDDSGNLVKLVGEGQDFMGCVLGSCMCGVGIAMVFLNNGSTGGTDIIAAIVNKYRDITFGRMIMYLDIIIISSCYFVFHDWRRVMFGYTTLIITSLILDYVINSTRQSVQFLIISNKYDEIASAVNKSLHRGVTVVDGMGWYSKHSVKMLVILARRSQSVYIFRLVKDIDPHAFVSQSNVVGVYGEGFDRIKVK